MNFFVMMFVCNLLMPLIMIIGGYCMYKKPPRKINGLVGYRTAMSRKNEDTWFFAHDYCGRLWLKWGAILCVPTIAALLPFAHSDIHAISTVSLVIEAVQLCFLLGSIAVVEKALRRTFRKDGSRR